jgi:hypothetical protein
METILSRLEKCRIVARADGAVIVKVGSRIMTRLIGAVFTVRWFPMQITLSAHASQAGPVELEMVAEADLGWYLFDVRWRRDGPHLGELALQKRFRQICKELSIADTADASLVLHGDGETLDEEGQRASLASDDAHDPGWQARRLIGGASLLVSAASAGFLAFSLREVAVNPPDLYLGGDKYSYGFQFPGAVAFLVPVAVVAVCFALAGAALVRADGRLARLLSALSRPAGCLRWSPLRE